MNVSLGYFPAQAICTTYLVVVAVEESKEAGLCAGCALDTAEANIIMGAFEVAQVPKQLLLSESQKTDEAVLLRALLVSIA